MFRVEYKTTRMLKTTQYYIENEDIDNGAYRKMFEDAFYKYGDRYKVEEHSFGFIVTLPIDVDIQIPVLELDCPKSKIKISEVIENAKGKNLFYGRVAELEY